MSKRILVVDDDAGVLFVFGQALSKLGGDYHIETVQSGGEALTRVRASPFDLVITDLEMPGLDGLELTEAIRHLDCGPMVVWMTAYRCRGLARAARRLGVRRCLDKPVEVGEIRRVVREALQACPGNH